jgi:hypothetical protein
VKRSFFNLLLWLVISVFLFTIAFPTLTININGENYRFKGWDPRDVNTNSVFQEFSFLPSLDLQGGQLATLNVDMENVPQDQREAKLKEIREIVYFRLLKTNPGYFEIHSSIDQATQTYQLHLKLPEKISEDFLNLLITPANLTFWVEDSEALANLDQESAVSDPFAGRKASSLTNSDIESVRVISDSRCYFSDPNTPRNFCLMLTFKPEAKTSFLEALYASPTGQTPLLMVVDGIPIAVQSMGQFFSGTQPDRELMIYPGITDSWLATSVLGAIVSDKPLSTNVTISSMDSLEPLLGLNTLSNIKISLFAAVIACAVLIYIYFRKRSYAAILALALFVTYDIALMKVFNLMLDLPLIAGFMASLITFLFFMIFLLYRIRTYSKGGLGDEELFEVWEQTKKHYRDLSLLVIIGAFVVSLLAPIFVINFYNGFGFGIIIGLFIFYFPLKHILGLFFNRDEKWSIF